jgi:hypothetical protein
MLSDISTDLLLPVLPLFSFGSIWLSNFVTSFAFDLLGSSLL